MDTVKEKFFYWAIRGDEGFVIVASNIDNKKAYKPFEDITNILKLSLLFCPTMLHPDK